MAFALFALTDDAKDLLVERLRGGLGLVFVGIALFGVADPVVHPDRLVPLYLVIAAELAAVLATFWRLRYPITARTAVVLGAAVVCLLSLTTAASGVITQDAATSPVLILVLTMGAATLLPWGVGPQLIVQVVGTAAVLWNLHAVGGISASGSQPVAIFMGALAALYAAYATSRYHLERRRAEDAELEVAARQHHAELAHAARLSTLGGMAAGLAHEINQPLSAIVSYARGCARRIQSGEATPETLLPVIEAVSAQAMRAGEVLKRIQTFVRLGEVPRVRLDVNTLVGEALRFAEVEARQLGVTLHLELAPGTLDVDVDPIQIEQVILNLVHNGFEAMVAGPVDAPRELTIRTTLEGPDGIEIAVADTGSGVAASVAQRLFDPFFTTKRDGLGLGLSISRSIAEAHDGRLWMTPNAPRGSTFHLLLPAVRRARGATAA